jgi:hypothetical protein
MSSLVPILTSTIRAAPSAAAAIAESAPGVLQAHGIPSEAPISEGTAAVKTAAANTRALRQIARLPRRKAHNITKDLLGAAHDTTKHLRDERMRQARLTFNAAIILVVVGVLIIFVGVALILIRQTTTSGTLTAGLGAIVEVVSAILFRLHNETNNRLDELGKSLGVIESAQIAMALIDRIEDPSKRDDAIREAARELRGHGQSTPPDATTRS